MVGEGPNQCEFADKQFSRMKSLGCLTEILTCRGATRLFAKNRIKDKNVSFSLDAATSFSSDLNILLFHGLLTAILCGADKCIQRRNVKMRIVKRKMLKMSVFWWRGTAHLFHFFKKPMCPIFSPLMACNRARKWKIRKYDTQSFLRTQQVSVTTWPSPP